MLEFEIIQKVNFKPISQDYIKELIVADIKKANPEVNVTDIEFVSKRNPNRIEAEVSARIGEGGTFALDEPETISEGDSDKQEEIPLDESTEAKEEVATTTVADIFSQTSA